MKQFLLFFGTGSNELPWSVDPVVDFDTADQAQWAAESRERSGAGNWAKVVDRDLLQIVRTGEQKGVACGYWWTWQCARDNEVDQQSDGRTNGRPE